MCCQNLGTIFFKAEVLDTRLAIQWLAKGNCHSFWAQIRDTRMAVLRGNTRKFSDCNINQVCYTLGWGMYWYMHGTEGWANWENPYDKKMAMECLDYYCESMELQQKSIFTFLRFWNETTGVKEPARLISKMVWEQREERLIRPYGS
jgi:hypothetical protein